MIPTYDLPTTVLAIQDPAATAELPTLHRWRQLAQSLLYAACGATAFVVGALVGAGLAG